MCQRRAQKVIVEFDCEVGISDGKGAILLELAAESRVKRRFSIVPFRFLGRGKGRSSLPLRLMTKV